MGRLLLVRHGETEWARDGRHTGLTDVPLTAAGEAQARALAPAFVDALPRHVVTSPLGRARRTAELAGLSTPASPAAVDPDLVEWDYGGYEGLTTPQIRERTGHPWTVFADGVVPGSTPGETLEQVAARTRRVLERVRPLLTESDVVLVGHGHCLRVLASCWLGEQPELGAHLLLDPGTVCVLDEQHDVPAIRSWNAPPPTG
ncbi:histidine phosphatase family protein [Angustibacter peucedani]